ncbi:MAG: hypothetical protein ACJAWV_002110 [Flammeovirgaceae bacterium]|jgi:hypothetical protein
MTFLRLFSLLTGFAFVIGAIILGTNFSIIAIVAGAIYLIAMGFVLRRAYKSLSITYKVLISESRLLLKHNGETQKSIPLSEVASVFFDFKLKL